MRSLSSVAVLVGLATMAGSFAAQVSATQVQAQEFRIEEATSAAGLAVDQLKPKTIAFIDRPGDELIDPDAGLISFEDWVQATPVQKQFLSPYPSYVEPTSRSPSTGCASASRRSSTCMWGRRDLRSRVRPTRSTSRASWRFRSSSAWIRRSSTA